MEYIPRGVCSRLIRVEVDDNKIQNVEFVGGCDGNLQGISRLVKGMTVDEAIERLQGIHCGQKATSLSLIHISEPTRH